MKKKRQMKVLEIPNCSPPDILTPDHGIFHTVGGGFLLYRRFDLVQMLPFRTQTFLAFKCKYIFVRAFSCLFLNIFFQKVKFLGISEGYFVEILLFFPASVPASFKKDSKMKDAFSFWCEVLDFDSILVDLTISSALTLGGDGVLNWCLSRKCEKVSVCAA